MEQTVEVIAKNTNRAISKIRRETGKAGFTVSKVKHIGKKTVAPVNEAGEYAYRAVVSTKKRMRWRG